MRERVMGRLGWQVSEVGYGMWGIAGGSGGFAGADCDLGAGLPGPGRRARLQLLRHRLGRTARGRQRAAARRGCSADHPDRRLYVATKIPPKNREWPPRAAATTLDDVFPADHIREYTETQPGRTSALPRIDLMQFHVWEDRWADDERWQRAVAELKREGLIDGVGISVNRGSRPTACRAATPA